MSSRPLAALASRYLITLVVRAFLIGCAVLLVVGASGVLAETSKNEEARCQGTRTFKKSDAGGGTYITNDLPGCPKGGLLLGTEGSDRTISRKPARPGLSGEDGDDEIRGLGGSDEIFHGSGDDVIYAGPGNDDVYPDTGGKDVIYGGDGNDMLASNDDGGDKLYCGAGRDKYFANPTDYVDSSCETASASAQASGSVSADPCNVYPGCGHDVVTASSSASPVPIPPSGGPAILPAAALALLLGSGILTYAVLRRR